MNRLQELQKWYSSQCDGDWEHGNGIKIATLDNPGWTVTINLADTSFQKLKFDPISYGVGKEAVTESEEWLHCQVTEMKFVGHGGPQKLEEILEIFLEWTKGITRR